METPNQVGALTGKQQAEKAVLPQLGVSPALSTQSMPPYRGIPSHFQLLPDTRGGVLVLGIVMAALLIGVLWHIVGLGDAAIWRERTQAAADAAAFENAVWHARGMNVMVTLNLLMLLVLSVLALWRLVLVVLTVAAVVGADTGQAALNMVDEDEARVALPVLRVLGGMRSAQMTVASAVPVLAAAAAVDNTNNAYKVRAYALSSAFFPVAESGDRQDILRCFDNTSSTGQPALAPGPTLSASVGSPFALPLAQTSRLGSRVSLPVQADDFSLLCRKTVAVGAAQLPRFLVRAGVAPGSALRAGFDQGISSLRRPLQATADGMPAFFCNPLTDAALDGVPDDVTELVGRQQLAKQQAQMSAWRASLGAGATSSSQSNNQVSNATPTKRQVVSVANHWLAEACGKPAKIWDPAANGNVFMRTFAWTYQDPTNIARTDRALEIADGKATGNINPPSPQWIAAHGEMYFDCAGTWTQGCRANAAWQIRWKARLRRIHSSESLAASTSNPALAKAGIEALQDPSLYRFTGAPESPSSVGIPFLFAAPQTDVDKLPIH